MKDVFDSQEIRDDRCLRGFCSMKCFLRYKVGKKIVRSVIPNVDELLTKGRHFDTTDISNKLPPKPVEEMPNVETVGLDLILKRVWNSIEDEKVSVIGLYGMAGVGKTTLLKRIHNEFGKRKHDISLVLWVVVSRDFDVSKIMNDIRNRIGIGDDTWRRASSQDQRVAMIYQVLKKQSFVLMLDDLWDKLELEKVGVPTPKETNNKSKVLFTTRFEDVCAKMQTQKKFEVKCLLEKEAFDLFCQKVGDETLKSHIEIPNFALEMTKECAGLPLALTTVGSAMAGVKSLEAWKQAKNDLKGSPWTASDLEKKVFDIIKFSFDRLPNETHRSCFLYCALYPEDFAIEVDDLILRWIGEGFLGEDMIKRSSYDMYEQGKSIIEKLKLSSLLEGVEVDVDHWSDRVKMHDLIRDMALWIARDKDKNKFKVLVQGEALALQEMDSERLNGVEKISLINATGIWKVPACPNIITLCIRFVVQNNDYSNLNFMERLKVLDLSHSGLTHIPAEIGKLLNLEYLNLSHTRIEKIRLPAEMKNLKNLRVFLMEDVSKSEEFEITLMEVIVSFEQLKVFRFSYYFDNIHFEDEIALLEKLESLPKLEEMHMQVTTITAMHKLLESNRLLNMSRHFRLQGILDPLKMTSLLESFSRMEHLEYVAFERVENIIEGSLSVTNALYLRKLRRVEIMFCHSITHLTWLKYAPFLEFLDVCQCDSIEEIVRESEDEEDTREKNSTDIFPNLKLLILERLPRLKSIHKRAIAMPSLKFIKVMRCPRLRKLPLSYSFGAYDNLIEIYGTRLWWDKLEWEDTDMAFKDLLQSKFIHYGGVFTQFFGFIKGLIPPKRSLGHWLSKFTQRMIDELIRSKDGEDT